MLSDDEILGLWSEGKAQAPARPVLGSKKVIAFARAVEREAYKRAAAECRRLGGHPIWIASAYHCAEAIEALGREK
jgi:hypothetical protein